ncbi:glycosyltransferase family 4 protein [Bifidobacterium reuteri]|uniref:glycosyltransferase family 4 protein n=1 Tax=Bifidobacterium reuteri TaxID=983706 RepID=UPI00168C0B89|nr:glycosyltransferase family 4 protein [Bifidobacterium reuteri]
METLIMSLVRRNESEQRMELTVTSVADDKAQQMAEQYRHTKFLFIPQSSNLIEVAYHYWQAIWKRIFPQSHIMTSLYYRKVLRAIRNEHFDAVVFEGGESYGFKAYDQVFHGTLWYHIHATPEFTTPSAYFNDAMAISDFVAQQWRHWCTDSAQHVHVLYNGVDTAAFRQAFSAQQIQNLRAQYGFTSDDFIVLFCGRLFRGKGVKELAQAVASIHDGSVKLLIAGYAHDAEAKKYAAELDAIAQTSDGRIKLTGYIPNEKMPLYYHSSDIQVVPSLWEEGAGNICIEGMAAGLPIIATKSGGMPEYLDPRCSVLVDRGETLVQDLAANIIALKNRPEQRARMSSFAQQRAEHFSNSAYYDAYVHLLADQQTRKEHQ